MGLEAAPVLALLALALAIPAAGQEETAPPTGAELYFRQGCYGCHGFDGKSRIMPLSTATSGVLQSEEAFIAFLRMREELNPMLPSSRMPNYPASALPDEDARAIYEHIQTLQTSDPTVDEIPVLRAILEAAASE